MFDGGPIGDRTRPPRDDPWRPAAERLDGGGDARDRRDAALRRLAEALLIAAVSPALPGIAQLRAGRVRLGAALLGVQALLVTAAAVAAAQGASSFLDPPMRPGRLLVLTAGCVIVAALWAALIVHSYAVLVPDGLSPLWRLAGGTTVAVLCLLVIVPPLSVAHHAYLHRDLAAGVFGYAPHDGARVSTLRNTRTKGSTRSHAADSYATFARFRASIL